MRALARIHGRRMRVALVTEELPTIGPSGGIGAAFHELALALSARGADCTIIYVPTSRSEGFEVAQEAYRLLGIELLEVIHSDWTYQGSPEGRSYAVRRYLTSHQVGRFDFIHFHEFKGLGFFYLQARRLGLIEEAPRVVLQLHGPTRWTLEANKALFTHSDQLKVDWMERQCMAMADILVSPSQYLADYVHETVCETSDRDIAVIKNVFTSRCLATDSLESNEIRELVFFGRHEGRKGIAPFCDALDRLNLELAKRHVRVTFLGSFAMVGNEHSGVYLAARAQGWGFEKRWLPGLSRNQANDYLEQARGALVVVPSPIENSPYTVLEALAAGRPTLTSNCGGARELLDEASRRTYTCDPTGSGIAESILTLLAQGCPSASLAESATEVIDQWIVLHNDASIEFGPVVTPPATATLVAPPLVSVVVTHYERPGKLLDAVHSVLSQDYANIEVIVVDDGSTSQESIQALSHLEVHFKRLGVRLVRQENRYLGAARNAGIAQSRGELIMCLDDDDLALPTLVSTCVTAQMISGASVIVPLSWYLPVDRRPEARADLVKFREKVSYLPLGGPLSLAITENVFGAATALFTRTAIESVGGYSEVQDVGHEDFELFARLVMRGISIEVLPEPLYLYEVGAPSMISRTWAMANFKRVVDSVLAEGALHQFADFARLVAGRHAADIGYNRTHYRYSQEPEGTDLLELLDGRCDPDSSMEVLARFAERSGWADVAQELSASRAFRDEWLHARSRSPELLLRSRFAALREALVVPPGGSALAEPVVRLVLDPECTAGSEQLFEALESISTLTSVDLEWLNRVPGPAFRGRDGANRDAVAKQVVPVLERALLGDWDLMQMQSMIALHCWLLDMHSEQRSRLHWIVATEETEYLESNPDVAEALANGQLPTGLTHFVWTGRNEGRVGFRMAMRYASLEEVDIRDLLETCAVDQTVSIGARSLADRWRRIAKHARGDTAKLDNRTSETEFS